jgi:ribonuclease T1
MAIRKRVLWGQSNPFSDPRLAELEGLVKSIRQGIMPRNVRGGRVFENKEGVLPPREHGYYREYDVEPTTPGIQRSSLRIVLGNGGDLYVSGNHYNDFRQVIGRT